jgi:transcriptional regulator with XRE-family HTH domain
MEKIDISPEQIKELRKSLGMSQQEFAQTLGVGVATVSRWETGEAKPTGTAAVVIGAVAAGTAAPLLSSFGALGSASLAAGTVGVTLGSAGTVVGLAAWGLYRLLKRAFEGEGPNNSQLFKDLKGAKK